MTTKTKSPTRRPRRDPLDLTRFPFDSATRILQRNKVYLARSPAQVLLLRLAEVERAVAALRTAATLIAAREVDR